MGQETNAKKRMDLSALTIGEASLLPLVVLLLDKGEVWPAVILACVGPILRAIREIMKTGPSNGPQPTTR